MTKKPTASSCKLFTRSMVERARTYGLDLENLKYDFGYPIGMIRSKTASPAQIRGNQNHPATYDFPIRMKLVEEWMAPESKMEEWAGWNISEYIKAAKELEDEGVKAIAGGCGLTGTMQEDLANAVDVPVVTSSLLQVPLVSRMLQGKKVGILTHSSKRCTDQNNRLLRSVGIDESIPIAIAGMIESEHSDVWKTQFAPPEKYDPRRVEKAIVAVAKKLVAENPDIGAIVLECTEMPLYAAAIREATGLPVFDGVGLLNYVYNAIMKKRYF